MIYPLTHLFASLAQYASCTRGITAYGQTHILGGDGWGWGVLFLLLLFSFSLLLSIFFFLSTAVACCWGWPRSRGTVGGWVGGWNEDDKASTLRH